jgi:hypothetical protein
MLDGADHQRGTWRMRKCLRLLLAVACCSTVAGCLARQVTRDGINLRQALVDLYTDQAMDNLVRAAENRPFVQLAYTNLQVQDTDKASANTSGGEADFSGAHNFDASKVGASQFTRVTGFSGRFPFGVGGERDRILSFRADPVTDQNYVYERYVEFARNPALLMVGDGKPTWCVHLARRCGGKWYWIPVEAGPAFQQLVLTTSFLPPPAAVPVYWDTTIASITAQLDQKTKEPLENRWVVTFSKQVPNDDGVLTFSLKGGKKVSLPMIRVPLMPVTPDQKGSPAQSPGPGMPTSSLYTQFDKTTIPTERLIDATGAPAQFFAQNFPNLAPPPSKDNQKIQDTLESIRLLLNKTNPLNP